MKIIIEFFSGVLVGSFFGIISASLFLIGIKVGKMISDEFDKKG